MEVKQGSTFLLGFEVEVDGVAQNLSNWTVTAGVGTKNRSFYQALTVTVTDAVTGKFELSAPTATWPMGQLFFDLKYVTDSGQIILSEFVEVMVTQSITK